MRHHGPRHGSNGLALTALCVSLGLTSQVWAQGTAEQRKACTPDALQYCSDAIPEVDKVLACMRKNYSKLSPACQAVFPAGDTAEAKPQPQPEPHGTTEADAQERAARAVASDTAVAITRQIITGVGQACGNGTIPPEVCSAYRQFLGTVGR